MYRCEECQLIFENAVEIHEEHGEIFEVCPECLSMDYVEVVECPICNMALPNDETYHGLCEECIRGEFTNLRGLQFIEKHMREFYLDYTWGIERMDENLKNDLITVLEKEFLTNLDVDDKDQLKDIKDFCLFDLDEWANFLKEEVW